MAAEIFTTLADAKAIVLRLIPGLDDEELEAMLTASAGQDCVDSSIVIYRPYAVAALFIRTRWQQYTRLKSAAGSEIEYSNPFAAFRALSELQGRYDADICEIPSSWSAATGQSASLVF